MSLESNSGEALVYLGYHETCSREVACAIVGAAALVYGIAAEILPTDSEKDMRAIYNRIYGTEFRKTSDDPVAASIFRAVDLDSTIVAQTKLIGGGSYELFAARLEQLEAATFNLSAGLE